MIRCFLATGALRAVSARGPPALGGGHSRGMATATLPLKPSDRANYERDGFLVVKQVLSKETCEELIARMETLIQGWTPRELSVFSTQEQTRKTDDYFLESADKVHFFLEEKALDKDGKFTTDKRLSLNKVGHALHEKDPLFRAVAQRPALAQAVHALGYVSPDLVQSMYIFKQPHIGGEVTTHQDSTFLYTEPPSCIGCWFALEDATLENGCLWAVPGSHKRGITRAFHRNPEYPEGPLCTFKEVDDPNREAGAPEGGELVPLPVEQGDLVMIHGAVEHMSKENVSPKSRHTFQLHMVEDTSGVRVGYGGVVHKWPEDNWLQYPKGQRFPKFETLP